MRLAVALLAIGCGGAPMTGAPVPGVRERIVAAVPVDHVPVMPRQAPMPGEVRAGLVAGATAPLGRARAPEPSEGQRHTPSSNGELFVGVGLPGGGANPDGTAFGWELAGGVTAAPSPGERAHDLDPMLAAPDRDLLGGYLQLNGTVSSKLFVLGASFAVRAVEIPYAWDYGDCAGGPGCPVWSSKGAPVAGEGLAWGGGGSLMLGFRPDRCVGVAFGAGIELLPSIARSRRDDVACDANGNCTGGLTPSAPTPGTSEFYRQYFFGGDVLMTRWSRAFLMLVYTMELDTEAGRVQARGGVEARF